MLQRTVQVYALLFCLFVRFPYSDAGAASMSIEPQFIIHITLPNGVFSLFSQADEGTNPARSAMLFYKTTTSL